MIDTGNKSATYSSDETPNTPHSVIHRGHDGVRKGVARSKLSIEITFQLVAQRYDVVIEKAYLALRPSLGRIRLRSSAKESFVHLREQKCIPLKQFVRREQTDTTTLLHNHSISPFDRRACAQRKKEGK